MNQEYFYNRIASYNTDAEHSRVLMLQYLMKQQWPKQKYIEEIKFLTTIDWYPGDLTRQRIKYIHLYVTQIWLKHHFSSNKSIMDPDMVLISATSKMIKMMSEHATLLAMEDGAPTTSGVRGGTKTEKAESIFKEHFKPEDLTSSAKTIKALYRSELEMSGGGATTYYHKFKKLLGK